MTRSVEKGPFIDAHLLKKVKAAVQTKDKKPVKAWSRRPITLPDLIGLAVAVRNGRQYVSAYVTGNMAGHKLDGFALTRMFEGHATDEKVKR